MSNPNTIVHEFLYECEPIYHKLVHLRAKVVLFLIDWHKMIAKQCNRDGPTPVAMTILDASARELIILEIMVL